MVEWQRGIWVYGEILRENSLPNQQPKQVHKVVTSHFTHIQHPEISEASKKMSTTDTQETVHVDLDGFTAEEEDREEIINLTNTMFRFIQVVDVGSIADEIVSQNDFGSVVKDVESDCLMGVCAALRSSKTQPSQTVNSLMRWVIESAKKYTKESDILTFNHNTLRILEEGGCGPDRVGFLIYDRIINMPVKISLYQLQNISNDLEFDGRAYCDYLILIQKIYYNKTDTKRRRFQLEEQELLEPFIMAQFEVPLDLDEYGLVCSEEMTEGIPFRRVVLIKGDSLPDYVGACLQAYDLKM